jgi:hypothetical protein
MSIHNSIVVVLAVATVAGCGGAAGSLPEPNQTDICQTDSHAIAENCKPGQKIAFLPAQFGNAQLPVYFAAANCDLRYSVVLTNGAVTCIFKPIKAPAEAKAPSASESLRK